MVNFILNCYGNFIFKPKTIRATIRKINYELDLGQMIDSRIYFFGCFEKETTNCLSQLVKPGMTVLDIGANIGCHTLPMAKSVGNSGRIVAFEPMDWARKKLKKNVSLNKFNNIQIEKIALSNVSDKQKTRFRSNWPIDNSFQQEASTEQNILFEKLDNYINEKGLSVDLIKIDVDGYEYKVFRGAHDLLKKQKPIILTEFGYTTNRVGEKVEDMIQFVKDLGYGFYSEKNLKEISDPLVLLNTRSSKHEKTINVVLIHRDDKVIHIKRAFSIQSD